MENLGVRLNWDHLGGLGGLSLLLRNTFHEARMNRKTVVVRRGQLGVIMMEDFWRILGGVALLGPFCLC